MSQRDVLELMFSHLSSPAVSVHTFVKNAIVAHTPVRGFPALPIPADMNLFDLPTLPASGRLPSIAQPATLTALPWAGSVRSIPSTIIPRRKSHLYRTRHSTSPSPRASAYAEAETAESSSSSSSSVHSLADYDRTAATLYDLLGISRTGTQAEIKGAYRQLARRYHPDTNRPGSTPGGLTVEECTRRFIEVQEAYEILSDPQRRAMYDFEMMHGRGHAWRNRLRQQQAPATWRQGRRASANADPIWQNSEEELAVKASWKAQWQNQMDGLRNRGSANPKPGSWAARMRQQHHERQNHGHEQGETSDV